MHSEKENGFFLSLCTLGEYAGKNPVSGGEGDRIGLY